MVHPRTIATLNLIDPAAVLGGVPPSSASFSPWQSPAGKFIDYANNHLLAEIYDPARASSLYHAHHPHPLAFSKKICTIELTSQLNHFKHLGSEFHSKLLWPPKKTAEIFSNLYFCVNQRRRKQDKAMTFRDYFPLIEAFSLIALVLVAAILLVWYLERRKRDRFETLRAKWQAIGLTPKISKPSFLSSGFDTVEGEYRGRRLTMHRTTISYGDGYEAPVTRIRISVKSPFGSRLTITTKLPQVGSAGLVSRIIAPKTNQIEDHFRVQSDPPELASRLLAVPSVSVLLLSDPKPEIELINSKLRFERPGEFPDPQDALALFDMVCVFAEAIEQVSS